MVCGGLVGKDVNFGKRILAFDRNFSTLDNICHITGLGETDGQRSLWAEGPLRKGLDGVVFKNQWGR